ncbi:MAG TPA: hypothetical protein VNX61_17320, partial [Rhizomicrobium sp.]|nr:hypothetical protein [Rhizomicrobium sp.]
TAAIILGQRDRRCQEKRGEKDCEFLFHGVTSLANWSVKDVMRLAFGFAETCGNIVLPDCRNCLSASIL